MSLSGNISHPILEDLEVYRLLSYYNYAIKNITFPQMQFQEVLPDPSNLFYTSFDGYEEFRWPFSLVTLMVIYSSWSHQQKLVSHNFKIAYFFEILVSD